MIRVHLYDENNVLICDLGRQLPEVPQVRESISIAENGKYTSRWVVIVRNWCFNPTEGTGMVALGATQIPVGEPNVIAL